MDRELLLEIGCEEIPASWLLPLSRQLGERLAAELVTFRISAGASVETHATPRRLMAGVSRISERQTDLDEQVTGPPVAAAFGPNGEPTPAAIGFAKRGNVEPSALTIVENAKGKYVSLRAARARQGDRGRAAGRPRRDAARPRVPEGDALGRVARRRQGRADVRPSDPLDPLPARRPRRPVRDPPQQRRGVAVGPGRALGRGDLRPSRAGRQRPRRPRPQGALDGRLPGQAGRALRAARARGAPRAHRPRARRARAPPRRPRRRRRRPRRAAPGSRRPDGVPDGRRRDVRRRVPPPARGGAGDDDDPSPAQLPGRRRRRAPAAGVPRRHQHRDRQRPRHRRQRRARADGAAARRAVLLAGRSQGDAGVAARSPRHAAVPQASRQLSPQGAPPRAGGRPDRARVLQGRSRGGARAAGRTPREGRSRHRHGAGVHRAAGHDGRPLRQARRPARGRGEGDLLPLPAGRRRAGAAADARGAGRRRGRLGGRLGRRQARFRRQPVRRRRAADRARAIRWRCAGRRRACSGCWSICRSSPGSTSASR